MRYGGINVSQCSIWRQVRSTYAMVHLGGALGHLFFWLPTSISVGQHWGTYQISQKNSGRNEMFLGVDSPFFSTIVIFKHRSLFPLGFLNGFLKRFGLERMEMEGTPRMLSVLYSAARF